MKLKNWHFRKFDLLPSIPGSNAGIGPKIIPPIASAQREQAAGLFREALRRFISKRQGGRTNQTRLGESGKTRNPGEGQELIREETRAGSEKWPIFQFL